MSSNKMWIQSDYYFNHKSAMDDRSSMWGADVLPVDMNGGAIYPKTDKYGMNDATNETTEQNIQERFALTTPSEASEDY